MVNCEHRSSPEGKRSSASLNIGSPAQRVGVVAVLIAGGDHQHAKPDDFGQAMHHLLRRPRVLETPGEPVGQSQPVFDLAQGQQTALRG
jgi:hypothetical protein